MRRYDNSNNTERQSQMDPYLVIFIIIMTLNIVISLMMKIFRQILLSPKFISKAELDPYFNREYAKPDSKTQAMEHIRNVVSINGAEDERKLNDRPQS